MKPSATVMPLFDIGDEFCIIYKLQAKSGKSLRECVNVTAAKLIQLGVKHGDRVAVCAPKSIDLCILMLATWALGAIVVPIFSGLKQKQVCHILRDCDPVLVFAGARDFELVANVYGPTLALDGFGLSEAPDITESTTLADMQVLQPTATVKDNDAALIIYTSGSSGQPKGVIFSRSNLVLGAKSVARFMCLGRDDRVLCVLPFSFDAGLNQLLSALIAGATVVLMDFIHGSQVEAHCAAHGITSMIGVPGLWNRIGSATWRDSTRLTIRRIGNTGGHLQAGLLQQLQNLFPQAQVFLMYGFTEAFRATCLEPARVALKPHSVGRSIPYASIAVVSEDGRLCQPYETGELVQFGPLVTLGYLNRPDEHATKFRPLPEGLVNALMGPQGRGYGFNPTHAATAAWSDDLVSIDEDGDIVYRGRKDDLIKINGFRICPGDVEAACVEAGLAIAIAIGLAKGSEESVVVFGKRADALADASQIRDRLRTSLPAYMIPRHILFLDDFPLTPNGKFDRQALHALALQLTGEVAPTFSSGQTP